jgi:hypothetical protein
MIRIRAALLTVAALALAIGCSSDHATSPSPPAPPPPPPLPAPGNAVVSLTTPNSDDGAVVVALRGPGLTTPEASDSATLFYSRMASDSEARVIVVGNVTSGPIFNFKIAHGKDVSAYSAIIQQVATRGDSLRANTNGYTLTIATPP